MNTGRLAEATHTLVDLEGAVLGVAFQVPVLDSRRPGSFLLTTGHAVRTLHARSLPVRLRAFSGSQREGQVLVCSASSPASDLALLYVDEWLGDPLPCVADSEPGEVLVRGAPAGVATEQANFEGRLAGTELRGDSELLDIVLPHLTYVESATGREPPLFNSRSETYAALRGLSGGPVCSDPMNQGLRVIGFVIKRNDAGIANRVYGLPIGQAAEELAAYGVTLQVERRSVHLAADKEMLTGLIGSLIGMPGGHHQLWGAVSGLLYSGEPIDQVLTVMIHDPLRFGLGEGLNLARAEFLLGRLLLKKDAGDEAVSLLRRAGSRAHDADPFDRDGLGALIGLRLLMESDRVRELRGQQYLVEAAIGRVSEIDGMSEGQRAYESASAAGREAMILSLEHPPPWLAGDRTASYFRLLADLHGSLLREHEILLRDKQEIVQIGLSLMSAIWADPMNNEAERHDRLRRLVDLGQVAAKQRSNAIFYCQMLLVDAMLSRSSGRELPALALACLTADALRKADLRLSHEGIRSILTYLRSVDPLLCRLVQVVHRLGIRKGITMMKATTSLDSTRQRQALENAAQVAELLSAQFGEFKGIMSIDNAFADLLGE